MSAKKNKNEARHVYITAGTKGGVGKSTAAIYFFNALTELGYAPVNVDCDNENPTFKRFLGEKVQELDISQPFALDKLISIIDESDTKDFVVDLKAGTGNETLKWFEDVPLEKMREEGINIYLLGCITSDVDSVKTFMNWASKLKDRIKFILVFNEKEGTDFSFFEQYASKFTRIFKPPVIVIPKLHEVYTNVLNQMGANLCDFLNGVAVIHNEAFQGRVPQSRLYRYYRKIIDPLTEVVKHD